MIEKDHEKTLFTRILSNMDWFLVISVLCLIAVGMIGIYSATLHYGNPAKYMTTQAVAILIGLVGLIFFMTFNYQYFAQTSYFLYGLSIFILLFVLFFGSTVRGTKGWFNIDS